MLTAKTVSAAVNSAWSFFRSITSTAVVERTVRKREAARLSTESFGRSDFRKIHRSESSVITVINPSGISDIARIIWAKPFTGRSNCAEFLCESSDPPRKQLRTPRRSSAQEQSHESDRRSPDQSLRPEQRAAGW